MDRRTFLRAGAVGATGSLGGCSLLSSGPPDVETNTGLAGAPHERLEGMPILLAGDTEELPNPPTRAERQSEAMVVLATPSASISPLAAAFRQGKALAFAGGGSQASLASLLDSVHGEYDYGMETINGSPVEVSVAKPHGDTAATFQFIREGGWGDPIVDPLGWAMHARLPHCDTFVPESSADDQYTPAGSAWIAGRLRSGEVYASRTRAANHVDASTRRLRIRTAMHTDANAGLAVAEGRRVADFPNDGSLLDWFPNPHERNGVGVSNRSDPIEDRLDVTFSPVSDTARGALTGCCGVTTDGTHAYDHRTRWHWTEGGVLGSESHYGGGSGRGEWRVS